LNIYLNLIEVKNIVLTACIIGICAVAAAAGNAYAQLRHIYANSYYKEATHMRYPIYRIETLKNLPIK